MPSPGKRANGRPVGRAAPSRERAFPPDVHREPSPPIPRTDPQGVFVSHVRLVLVEHLGAPGASDADARIHASHLQDAGYEVRTLLCDPDRVAPPPTVRPADRLPRFTADAAGLRALRAAVHDAQPTQVVVASHEVAGGAIAQALANGTALRWWPTAHGGPAMAAPARALDPAAGALDWATGDPARSTRARLPLWDGEYVLAPVPLAGRGGAQLIEAFARAAADEAALDLVVLGDPQPEFVVLARRLGVGMRVHFAGVAPRDAEFAWWSAATAAVFAGEHPFAAGLVWRALECGCPMLVAGDAPVPAALRAWLDGHGCLAGARAGGTDVLAAVLAPGLAATTAGCRAVTRGRELARAQHVGLAGRLAVALGRRGAARAA